MPARAPARIAQVLLEQAQLSGAVSVLQFLDVQQSCRMILRGDLEVAGPPGLLQSCTNHVERQFRAVAFVREVREDDTRQAGVQEVNGEASGRLIGQVPVARRDTPLHGHRVVARVQQDFVVIGFEYEEITPRECVPDLCGRAPEVSGHTEAQARALVHNCDAYRVRRVMDREERLNSNVAYVEGSTGIVWADGLLHAEDPVAGGLRPLGHVDRSPVTSRIYADATGVVTMLMRHDDRVDRIGLHTDGVEALGDRPAAEAGVDQDPRLRTWAFRMPTTTEYPMTS